MPPVKKDIDTSLQNFIKEFLNAPVNIPKQLAETVKKEIIGLYEKDFQKQLTTLRVTSTISNEIDSSVISTFVAGGKEALLDIKGVTTILDLKDLARNPIAALKALGNKTREDIFHLDELAGDRRSDILEALTKGNLQTVKGEPALQPQNMSTNLARRMGIRIVDIADLVSTTGLGPTSAIKLITKKTGSDDYEDRQIAETFGNTEAQYKAYRDLSGQLTAMAGYMENIGPRSIYYNGSVTAYNRSVASELGINLDDVLIVEKRGVLNSAGKPVVKSSGTLQDTFDAQAASFTDPRLAFENILSDDAKLRKALGLEAPTPQNNAIWANLSGPNKEFAKDFLRSEFVNQGLYTKEFGTGPKKVSAYQLDAPFLSRQILWEAAPERNALKKGYMDRETSRRALNAQLQAKLNQPQVLAAITNAAPLIVAKIELERVNSMYVVPGAAPIVDFTDARIPGPDLGEINSRIASAGNKARERFVSATKSVKIANNLFFASTTKEILESIEDKKFIETVLLASKFANLLPYSDPKWGTVSEYVKYIDKVNILGNTRAINTFIGAATGLSFETNSLGKIHTAELFGLKLPQLSIAKATPKLYDAETYLSWKTGTGASTQWTQARIKSGMQEGLFFAQHGKEKTPGLYEILNSTWGDDGKMFRDFGFTDPHLYNPDILLQDLTRTDQFLRDLKAGGDALAAGVAPTTEFQLLANALDLNEAGKLAKFGDQIAALNDPDKGGYAFLRFMADPSKHPGGFPVEAADRWQFLSRIVRENKIDQLTKRYAGLLNRFNRFANAIYTFLYREILWGGYAGSNVFIKGATKIFKPFLKILEKSGFGDDILISEAISKWNFVKYFNRIGAKFEWLGLNPGTATNVVSKSLVRFLGPAMMKNIGWILGNTTGIVSGGIGYLLAAVGDVAWNFSKKILKGDLAGAFRSSGRMLREKFRAVSKLVLSIVFGIFTCISIPFFFVFGIIAMMAPTEPSTGGGAYADIIGSQKLSVIKDSEVNGNQITYTITITNVDKTLDEFGQRKSVTIASFNDTLNYSKSCADGGGIVNVKDNPQYGVVVIPQMSDLPKTTLGPDESIQVGPFTLQDINLESGTYLNSVEVTAVDEPGKKAEAVVSDKFKEGGCSVCPAGWPTQPFRLTQSAYTYDSHNNSNALDLASGTGQAVKATHNGLAYRGEEPNGYGHYVKIISDRGFATIYAHLSVIYITDGQQIEKDGAGNYPVIGELGTSGNSTGPHLHYEFVNNVECLGSGKPLQMRRYLDTDGSYIPETIPNGCVGDTACNMSR